MRAPVLGEIAKYVVAELRLLGFSDGALCAWANFTGYESFKADVSRLTEAAAYDSLMQRMWKLVKSAGAGHEKSSIGSAAGWWTISSEAMINANRSEAWKATRNFRDTFEREKREKSPKKEDVMFYTPPPQHWQIGRVASASVRNSGAATCYDGRR